MQKHIKPYLHISDSTSMKGFRYMIMKKIVSLVVCLFILMVFSFALADYSGSNYTSNTDLADKITKLLNGKVSIFSDGSMYKVNDVFPRDKKFFWANASDSGYQCYAYANAAYNYLFGESPKQGNGPYSKSKLISGVKKENKLSYDLFVEKGIGCGAWIRTTSNSSGAYNDSKGHSIIILSYNSSNVTFLHAATTGGSTYYVQLSTKLWKDTGTWDSFNYYLFDGSDPKRYICAILQPYVTAGTETFPEVPEMTGGTAPSAISNGSSFTLKGTITCKYKLTEVRGTIYNCTTGAKVFDVAVNPNTTSYTLGTSGEAINSNLRFGDSRLNNSWCRYELKVTYNKNGATCIKRMYDRYFKVGSPANMVLVQPGVFEFACDEEARSGPAESNSIVKSYNKGDIVFVTGYEINSSNNVWLKLTDGSYVFSGDLNGVTWTETAINDTYTFTSNAEAKKYPYSSATTLNTYAGGAEAYVAARLTNSIGETWYRLKNNSYVPASVMRKDIPVTGFNMTYNSNMIVGKKDLVVATAVPSNATNQGKNWSSSNPSVATVDSSGYVRAVKSGTVTITVSAKDGYGASASCTITIQPASGKCGNNLNWSLSNGTLCISGTGEMYDYENEQAPWMVYSELIQHIEIGNGVTSIGRKAFECCSSLSTVSLPNTLTSIRTRAFRCCSLLESFSMPNSVTNMETLVFDGCKQLSNITLSNKLTLIPANTFYNCSALTHLTIPAGVKSIAGYAFWNCTELKEIVLSENLTSIADWAFSNCSALTSIRIPESATTIGTNAIYNCASVTIYVVDGSAAHTYAIEKGIPFVVVGGKCGNNLKWRLDGSALTIYGTGEMYNYGRNFSPYSTTAPWGSNITSLYIGEGVTSTGTDAFYYCSALSSAVFPSSLRTIGASSFQYCMSLREINIPAGVENVGYTAFAWCTNLQMVTIPESVTSIGDGAFGGCGKLSAITINSKNKHYVMNGGALISKSGRLVSFIGGDKSKTYTIPDWVKGIGDYAFLDCDSLDCVEIPEEVLSISNTAFEACDKETLYLYCWDASVAHSYAVEKEIPYKIIGGKCGNNLNWRLDGTELTIFGTGPMYDYTRKTEPYRTSAPWGSDITSLSIYEGVTTTGSNAFYYCEQLDLVNLPTSLKTIGASSFQYCMGLEEISIPAGVEKVGYTAFVWCTNLKKVTIPASVTSIGDGAFSGCRDLSVITIDSNNTHYVMNGGALVSKSGRLVSYIGGDKNYYYTIPDWVKGIGDYAFLDCDSLDYVEIPEEVLSISNTAFEACNKEKLYLYCWDGSCAYQFAINNDLQFCYLDTPINNPDFIIPGIPVIEEEAFAGIAAKRIRLLEGTTKIKANAFAGCPNLIQIYIPVDCNTIDRNAFSDENNLCIYGISGSQAEIFANTYGYSFVAVD